MANFNLKETIKKPVEAIIENPTVKKIAENDTVTKVAIPVTTTAISAALAVKRLREMKKQHKEDMEEYKKLTEKLEEISDKVDEKDRGKNRKSRFKKKRFSIEGGGFEKPSPRSIAAEGLKKIANDSKFLSQLDSEQSLVDVVRKLGDEKCTIGQKPESTLARLSVYQKGDVIVFMLRYLDGYEINKLGDILDTYCRTFKNADYSSETSNGSGFVELWIAEDSLDYLVNQLVTNGFSLNVVL